MLCAPRFGLPGHIAAGRADGQLGTAPARSLDEIEGYGKIDRKISFSKLRSYKFTNKWLVKP
jgi:hypothetical protein